MSTALIIFLLTLVAIVTVSVGALYLLYTLFSNIAPNPDRIQRDLEKLNKQLPPPKDLVPWSNEEMQLLSLDQTNQVLKKGLTKKGSGSLVSIYQEPMVNYSYKKYIAMGEDAALLVQTSNRKFEYRIKPKGIDIKLNNREIGTLRPNGVLYNRRNRIIARIAKQDETNLSPVMVFDTDIQDLKEVGNLVNPKKAKKLNPRALQLVENQMEKHEEDLFLALALYGVIQEKLKS